MKDENNKAQTEKKNTTTKTRQKKRYIAVQNTDYSLKMYLIKVSNTCSLQSTFKLIFRLDIF